MIGQAEQGQIVTVSKALLSASQNLEILFEKVLPHSATTAPGAPGRDG